MVPSIPPIVQLFLFVLSNSKEQQAALASREFPSVFIRTVSLLPLCIWGTDFCTY